MTGVIEQIEGGLVAFNQAPNQFSHLLECSTLLFSVHNAFCTLNYSRDLCDSKTYFILIMILIGVQI